MILLCSFMAINLVGFIWLLVVSFRLGAWWGLGAFIFTPFVPIIAAVKYPRKVVPSLSLVFVSGFIVITLIEDPAIQSEIEHGAARLERKLFDGKTFEEFNHELMLEYEKAQEAQAEASERDGT